MTEDGTTQDARGGVVRERLVWQAATRDDAQVAQALHAGEEVDAIHELSEAGLLDGFLHFLDVTGVCAEIGVLQLPGQERVLIPLVQMVVLYLLKVLLGIPSMNALPALLFSNVALMTLVGFNAQQIAVGFSRRGDSRRRLKRKGGPLSPQCLAQNISALPAQQMEGFFNGVIRRLIVWGTVRGDVLAALDGSKLPTTKRYAGRGCLTEEHTATEKTTKRKVTVVRHVFGWKVLVLIDVQTRLPLAMTVVPIQAYEGAWLLPLVAQAQANLAGYGRITTVVIDRGYLDGEDLWALDQQGITFVVVAKAGMIIREDALALAQQERPVERCRVVRHGRGRTAHTETKVTRLVGLEGLTTYDAYGTAEHAARKTRTDFAGHPLNAVVVQLWENRPPAGDGLVYLTNAPVRDPFVSFDTYDWRSVIENSIFKEGKYPWHLRRFPQRTEAAVVVHCHVTLAVMALCTAFRLWQANGAPEDPTPAPPLPAPTPPSTPVRTLPPLPALSTALLGGEGTERWRRRLKEENRDRVIVFLGTVYGIFHLAEVAVLTGLRLKRLPQEVGSRQAILARYGLGP
jgi:hypothetical protein